MTAQIVNLAIVREARGLACSHTAVPTPAAGAPCAQTIDLGPVPRSAQREAGFGSLRTGPASRVAEAMAAREPDTMRRLTCFDMVDGAPVWRCLLALGMTVRHRRTKQYLGTIVKFQTRPGLPGSAANVIVAWRYEKRFYSPEELEPLVGADIDPEPAA
jgi:hypothetical protein